MAFESVDEILKCGHSNKSYGAELSGSAVCFIILLQNEFARSPE